MGGGSLFGEAGLAHELDEGATFVGRFRVGAKLGSGGSATVYRATRLDDATPVALKIFHERHTDSEHTLRKRFERETRHVEQLHSPHVIRMLEHGYTPEDLPYIVLELLEGRSLKAALRAEGAFGSARAGRVALQLLEALAEAHAVDVAHRDVKPGNIFMCRVEAGADHAKLIDFGFAKASLGDLAVTAVTAEGGRVGTPRYMSPEQARGEDVVAASDLYALALVIAEMIVGTPVLRGKGVVEMLHAHAMDRALPLPVEVLDSPLGRVVQRGLSKAIAVRYQSALQMRADIEAALAAGDAAAPMADLAPTEVFDPAELFAQEKAILERRAALEGAGEPPGPDPTEPTGGAPDPASPEPAAADRAPVATPVIAPPPRRAAVSARPRPLWIGVGFAILAFVAGFLGYWLAG